MDLFWSGLVSRASEHIWNERRSQFSKVFETAIQDAREDFRKNGNIGDKKQRTIENYQKLCGIL